MKETKSVQIKFRLTENQKEQLERYCAAYSITISEAMRLALTEFLGGNKNGK